MNNYILSLALIYFKEKKDHYSISELMVLLGYNSKQIEELMTELFDSDYICYQDNLIFITPKGLKLLICNNQDDINIESDEFKTPHINPNKAISIDTIYVPKEFSKKYK